jgi:predicted metal-dependent hydrolase
MECTQRTVNAGGITIEYYLTRKRVKNINLRIRSSDGTVQVSAPHRTAVGFIDSFVAGNADFVLSALERRSRELKKTEYFADNLLQDGDEYILLGQRLVIELERRESESVEIGDGRLILRLPDTDSYERRRALLESRLDIMREEMFNRILDRIFPVFEGLGKSRPRLVIKASVSRWGYCQPAKNVVMMNKQLISVPVPLIEYLALHELTHLVYPDHSNSFWLFMQRLMSDCKARRKQLRNYSFLLKK